MGSYLAGTAKAALVAGLIGVTALPVVTNTAAQAQQSAAAGEKRILMVLWRIETEYDTYFKQRLDSLGYKVQYTTILGEQSRDKLAAKLRQAETAISVGSFDAVYTWGTTVTQMTAKIVRDRSPIVFNVVYDPVEAELVSAGGMPRPDKPTRIGGATNGVPIERQFDAFANLLPIRKLCLLFNARELNANLIVDRVTAWTNAHRIPLVPLRTAPQSEFLSEYLAQIKTGTLDCDTVYAGADSYLGSKAAEIAAAIGDKVKLLGGTERFVNAGWLAALAPDSQAMGYAAADIIAEIFKGTDTTRLPVVLPTPRLFINENAAIRHGITVPEEAIKRKVADGAV